MTVVQALAQVILDVLYVWAIILAIFLSFAGVVAYARGHRRRRELDRIRRLNEAAEFERRLIRAEGERREALRVVGGIERRVPR